MLRCFFAAVFSSSKACSKAVLRFRFAKVAFGTSMQALFGGVAIGRGRATLVRVVAGGCFGIGARDARSVEAASSVAARSSPSFCKTLSESVMLETT